jgi:hypothetical protein
LRGSHIFHGKIQASFFRVVEQGTAVFHIYINRPLRKIYSLKRRIILIDSQVLACFSLLIDQVYIEPAYDEYGIRIVEEKAVDLRDGVWSLFSQRNDILRYPVPDIPEIQLMPVIAISYQKGLVVCMNELIDSVSFAPHIRIAG